MKLTFSELATRMTRAMKPITQTLKFTFMQPRTLRDIKTKVRATSRVTELITIPPYICVTVRAQPWGESRTGIGFAKCNPVDVWNESIGYQIAKGRAEAAIAREMLAEIQEEA